MIYHQENDKNGKDTGNCLKHRTIIYVLFDWLSKMLSASVMRVEVLKMCSKYFEREENTRSTF